MPETIGYARPKMVRRVLSKEMERKLKSAVDRLKLGQDFRQKEREDSWRSSVEQYLGQNAWRGYSPEDTTADLVNINISFSTINTLVPFVADEDPSFIVEPDSEDADEMSAAVLETFINRLWRSHKIRGKRALADATFDHLVLGDGWLKVGYEIVDLPTYNEVGDIIGEGRIKIAEFSVSRVSPWDMWVDPYADGLHNARWVCQRILMPFEELKKDPRYKVTDDEDFGGMDIDPTNLSPEDTSRIDYLTDGWVAVYEFYDIKERWMMSFIGDGQQLVRYVEHVTAPFVQIPNYRIPNSPYHIGELEQIRSLQDEINKTRSQMMTHRRRNVMKWVVAEDRLSEEALDAMASSRVNDIIKIHTNEPIQNIIQAITPTPLSSDSYMLDDRLRADVNEITGVNEYLRGVPQNISRTATEASIIEGSTNIRTRHKLLIIETAAREAGQLLLDIIRDVLPLTAFEEMTMFVTGREAERVNRASGLDPTAGAALVTPNPEIFEGRYRVEVERGSTELRNPQVKAQQLMQMVNIMLGATPILQQLGIPFNLKRLLELWFEAEGIKDLEKFFEPDEGQAMMHQLAMQERMNAVAAAAGQGGSPGGAGISAAPGMPNRATAQAPSALIDPSNSGMLPPRGY